MEKIESLKSINELKNWESIPFKKVTKSQTTYDETEKYISNKLKVFIDEYSSLSSLQEKRLCRDLIDYSLRRFHQYSIQHRFKAFYFESPQPDTKVFEHIIPASTLRDLLLDEKIDIHHALYPPIASISEESDKKIGKAKLVKTNNDLWYPFKRYVDSGIFTSSRIVDCAGKEIDPNSFTLSDHYSYVDKLLNDSQPIGETVIFEELIEGAPNFARKFVEQVKQEFDSVDNASIEYTKCPDMRIRKIIDNGPGFINAATIRWQPRKKRFLLAISPDRDEIRSFGLTIAKEQCNSLPSVLFVDETLIKQKIDDILKCLKYAHEKHEHRGHR